MFPRIILCCLFFFASGNRISNFQSVTSELYLLTQSPHHLKLFAPGSTPLQCTAGNCSNVCRPRSKSGLTHNFRSRRRRSVSCVRAEGCDETETRAGEVRTVSWVENTARGPEWDTIHLTHSLLLSQNKYSPLGSEKKTLILLAPGRHIGIFSEK